jgi:hypothetical protein
MGKSLDNLNLEPIYVDKNDLIRNFKNSEKVIIQNFVPRLKFEPMKYFFMLERKKLRMK